MNRAAKNILYRLVQFNRVLHISQKTTDCWLNFHWTVIQVHEPHRGYRVVHTSVSDMLWSLHNHNRHGPLSHYGYAGFEKVFTKLLAVWLDLKLNKASFDHLNRESWQKKCFKCAFNLRPCPDCQPKSSLRHIQTGWLIFESLLLHRYHSNPCR